jgi:hypothetical protein
MLTLSYGFKKPQNPDRGAVWFPALEQNIQQLNDHTHNGTNSAKLSPTAISKLTQNVTAASWAAVSGKAGLYSQVVTLPAAITGLTTDNTIDDYQILIKDGSSGDLLYLTINKTTTTTFTVYANDNTLTLKVYYLT